MKFGVIIAARTASQRLPGKALLPLLGLPVIRLVIRRIKTSQLVSAVVLATTANPEDDVLESAAREEGISVFRGPQDDVLGRFVQAADMLLDSTIEYVVRVTADCPLVGGETLDVVLMQCPAVAPFDVVTTKPNYPQGIDYEIYSKKLLVDIDRNQKPTQEEREHILNYVYNREGQFRVIRVLPPPPLMSTARKFLLDTQEDYAYLENMLHGKTDIYVPVSELLREGKAREM